MDAVSRRLVVCQGAILAPRRGFTASVGFFKKNFSERSEKRMEKKEMGKVEEYEGLMKELMEIIELSDNIDIFKAEINKSTDLIVSARPLCFDVTIGKDLVYSCNQLENARTIFDVIRADLKGEVFHGNTCKTGF